MAYLRNEPIATDDLDVSQPKLRDNTNTADTSFGQNHYAFSDLTANNGKHKFAQFVNQASIPPGLVGGDETVYSKAIAGLGELFFTRGNTGVEIQITGPGDPVLANIGNSWIAGGVLVQWAQLNVVAGATTWVAKGMKAFPNNCFCAVVCSNTATIQNVGVTGLTKTDVTFVGNLGAGTAVCIIAVGN